MVRYSQFADQMTREEFDRRTAEIAAQRAAAAAVHQLRKKELEDERRKKCAAKTATLAVVQAFDNVALPGAAEAYRIVMATVDARLEDKRYAPRRPPCAIKVSLGQGFVEAEFKPHLVDVFVDGWTPQRLYLTLWVRGGGMLKMEVRPGGTLHSTRWTPRTAAHLLEIAKDLLRLLAQGEAHLLAAADADRCAFCGKTLTDPASRDAGIGPECIKSTYRRHDSRPIVTHLDLAAAVKDIRRQMQNAHPDRGGEGDGALFARLVGELDKLRAQLAAAGAGATQ